MSLNNVTPLSSAACENDSCQHGECVETINSHKCDCFEGFYGDKCEHGKKTGRWYVCRTCCFDQGRLNRRALLFLPVVQCRREEVTVPSKGRVDCTHTYGEFSYDSRCQYSCDEGYRLSSSSPLACAASGEWSGQPPTCDRESGDARVRDWF